MPKISKEVVKKLSRKREGNKGTTSASKVDSDHKELCKQEQETRQESMEAKQRLTSKKVCKKVCKNSSRKQAKLDERKVHKEKQPGMRPQKCQKCIKELLRGMQKVLQGIGQ